MDRLSLIWSRLALFVLVCLIGTPSFAFRAPLIGVATKLGNETTDEVETGDPNRANSVLLWDFSVTNTAEPVLTDVSLAGNDGNIGLGLSQEPAHIPVIGDTNSHYSFASNDYMTNHTLNVISNMQVGFISVWVNLDATNVRYRVMQLSNNQGGSNPGLLFIEADGTSRINISLFTNNVIAWQIRSTDRVLANTVGEWHQWGLRHNGINGAIFYDGVVIDKDIVVSTSEDYFIAETFQSGTPPNYISWGAALANGSIFFPLSGDLYRPCIYSNMMSIADIAVAATNTHPVTGTEIIPF